MCFTGLDGAGLGGGVAQVLTTQIFRVLFHWAHLLWARIVLTTVHDKVMQLSPNAWERKYHHPQFTDQNTEAHKG
jgi:ABC-type glycerol-3-phosphate transport system permease component